MAEVKEKGIVDWSFTGEGEEVIERQPLRSVIGKTLVIKNIYTALSQKYGNYVVIDTNNGSFYSFSEGVLSQSERVRQLLKLYDGVKVKVLSTRSGRIYFGEPNDKLAFTYMNQ